MQSGIYSRYNRPIISTHIEEVKKHLNKSVEQDFLIIYSQIDIYLDSEIKEKINNRKGKAERLNILLETPGGSPVSLKQTVDFLRSYYKIINFYIMGRAMSAGTMFCLSGNEIHMSNQAYLGPIDPQVMIGDKYVPAQSHLFAWENLIEKEQLSEAELIMVQKFNPAELEIFKQISEFSINLAEKWLIEYHFKNGETLDEKKEDEVIEEKANNIATELNNSKNWKIHSYPLNLRELRKMGLKIKEIKGDLFKELNTLTSIIKEMTNLYQLRCLIFLKEDKKNI